ncbi:unnamed protein product, partial [Rotaria magnacalcarata]
MRTATRSNFAILLVLFTICMTFISFHLYESSKSRQQTTQIISTAAAAEQKTFRLLPTTLNNEKYIDK